MTSAGSSADGKSASGLGKGLAGILGDALATERAPEVSNLLGAATVRRDPEVRKLVTELALDALADGFGADMALIVGRDDDGGLASVSPRLPASWNTLDSIAFETVGRLWSLLEHESGEMADQRTLGPQSLLTVRCDSATRPLAAGLLRPSPFDPDEERIISRLVRSVAVALYSDNEMPSESAIRVLTRGSNDRILADVRIGDTDDRRNAAAVADDPVTAVARASAELCDAALTVTFAGQTRVHSSLVTVVVLGDAVGGPLFGLAVTDPASSSGPAEAVFSAAKVANYDPFVLSNGH